jgi:hypothetical protein
MKNWIKNLREKSSDFKALSESMILSELPYEVKYAEVNRIEELIDNKDTEILTEFVKRRNYFWT